MAAIPTEPLPMSEPDSLTTPQADAPLSLTTCEMSLMEEGLWREFHSHQNEMIITKAGRCLFPLLRLASTPRPSINPSACQSWNDRHYLIIDSHEDYMAKVEIQPLDEMKWKWRQHQWMPILSSRSVSFNSHTLPCSSLECLYHESISGEEILNNGLNFDKIKLSNKHHEDGRDKHKTCFVIVLQSFRRYIPIIKIIPRNASKNNQFREQVLVFPETAFVAVTHYQNEQITILKKSYNPHAKGFVVPEEPALPPSTLQTWSMPSTSGESSQSREKSKRPRKRIKPLPRSTLTTATTIPSDEEELQGSLALHTLGT